MAITVDETSARIVEQVRITLGATSITAAEDGVEGVVNLLFNKPDHASIAEMVSLADLKAFSQALVDYCRRIETRAPAKT